MKNLTSQKLSSLVVLIIFFAGVAHSQCLTDLKQLLPSRAESITENYGQSLALGGEYMVVGAYQSDTLKTYVGGAVYVYKRSVTGWNYVAMLTPTVSTDYLQFGYDVEIDEQGNTIVVVAWGGNQNAGAYVFEKPAGEWTDMNETAVLPVNENVQFTAVDVNDDGTKIAVGTPYYQQNSIGAVWVFTKPAGGWSAALQNPFFIQPPAPNAYEFGYSVKFNHDDLVIGARSDEQGPGAIYVYEQELPGQYARVAKLISSGPPGLTNWLGHRVSVKDDVIVGSVTAAFGDEPGVKLFVFKKDGIWKDAFETTMIKIGATESEYSFYPPFELISDKEIAVSSLVAQPADVYHVKGKVLLLTASDDTWSSVTRKVLYEETDVRYYNPFALDLAWNGDQLVFSRVQENSSSLVFNAIGSVTRSNNVWGSLLKITSKRFNSSSFYYGTAMVKQGDELLVGSPWDAQLRQSGGSVYVHEKQGSDYVKIHQIPAPLAQLPYGPGGRDDGFGYALAVNGDELAVSGWGFVNASGLDGKVFIYKRTTSSWKSAVLYDTLEFPSDLDFHYFGTALAMNDNVLFVSTYNYTPGLPSVQNTIAVYEKKFGKWEYADHIDLGNALIKSKPVVVFDLVGDELLVGSFTINSPAAFMMKKDAATGKWRMTTRFSPTADQAGPFELYGGGIKLTENHVFIGNPTHTYDGFNQAGAVFVFSKNPGDVWPDGEVFSTTEIRPEVPIPRGLFGYSVAALDNTLIVGAPGAYYNPDFTLRHEPGSAYVIQAQDYYWTNTTELLRLQGEAYNKPERDYFGNTAVIDKDNFCIAAPDENTSNGFASGAVYHIPNPPMIKLVAPVCLDAGEIVLEGYPFGGTWSGQGLVSGKDGVFDPALAGPGTFTLMYLTPNCAYPGRLQITVLSPTAATLLTPANVVICPQLPGSIKIASVPNATYKWFYKGPNDTGFNLFHSGDTAVSVTLPGEYYCQVAVSVCMSESAITTVTYETPVASIGPQPVVCNTNSPIQLIASPPGGIWSGSGITNSTAGSFGAQPNGEHQVTYSFQSVTGCNYSLKDTVLVAIVPASQIMRAPTDFCGTGKADLSLTLRSSDLNYEWFYQDQNGPESIDNSNSWQLSVVKKGTYTAMISNGYCSVTTPAFLVGFEDDLGVTFTPPDSANMICGTEIQLIAEARENTTFTWMFGTTADDLEIIAEGIRKNSIVATQNGFYKFFATYGFCEGESSTKYIEFLPADSMWLPNVFTPNGDPSNEIFQVSTNLEHFELKIFNRYGNLVYETSESKPYWTGVDFPSGVYYWNVFYKDCENNDRQKKGFVQLLR